MRIFTFIFLLLFSTYNLLAQGLSFDSVFPNNRIIPVEGKGFVLASAQAVDVDSVVLVYFGMDVQPVSTVTIPLRRKLGELQLEDIFVWEDKVVVLKSLFYPGQRRNHLLMYEYSLPDLELLNSKQLTDAHHPPDLRLPFYYSLSPDHSKLLITSWSFFASDSLAQMELLLFDQEWQKSETRIHQLPYKNENISIYGCKIDDAANCYLLGDVYTGKNINYAKPKEIKNFVIASFQDTNGIHTYELEVPELTIDEWHFELDKQQNLVAISLYREGTKFLIEGSLFFRIDRLSKEISKSIQKVDKEAFVDAFASNELGFRTPKNRFVSYVLSSVIVKEDAYYIVAENFNASANELRDILVMSIGLDGNLKWLKRLPKAQELGFGTNSFASFMTVDLKEELLFFYNGNTDNFEKEHGDKVKSTTESNAAFCVTMLNLRNQKIVRQELSQVYPDGYIAVPELCKKVATNKVAVMTIRKDNNIRRSLHKYNVQILTVGK